MRQILDGPAKQLQFDRAGGLANLPDEKTDRRYRKALKSGLI